MRSIGKRNIAKLKAIVSAEAAKGIPGIHDRVIAQVPTEWYEIWEGACDEIERIADDELCRIIHQR